MKIDLVEINKLSPPGLWDLASLSAVISMLLGVIKSGLGGHGTSPFYVRMITWHSKNLRDKTRENLGIRIKAWVMQYPARIAWVRSIIGEAAIIKWRKNRLADYALTKYFGDWKRKWPNGFRRKVVMPKRLVPSKYMQTERPYNWKLFALLKIENVERFLFDRPANSADIVYIGNALETRTWSQIRKPRILKPIEFTPNELVAEAATGKPQGDEELIGKIENPDDVIENMGVKKLNAPPDKIREETTLKIEEHKPP